MNNTQKTDFLPTIRVFDENERKKIVISKTVLVFGPSHSGKTDFLDYIEGLLTAKKTKATANGVSIRPNDFFVLSISTEENIEGHLKLSSKSVLRRYVESIEPSIGSNTETEKIKEGLENLSQKIETFFADSFPGYRVRFKGLDDPFSLVLDNASIDIDSPSSSTNKFELIKLALQLADLSEKESFLLVDDFTDALDEEEIATILREAQTHKCHCVFSSRHPIPQTNLNDEIIIYRCSENGFVLLPTISDIFIDVIDGQTESTSFEDYMLGKGYAVSSGVREAYLNLIKGDDFWALTRLLCSRNAHMADEEGEGLSIVAKTGQEKMVYASLLDLLGMRN